MQEPDDKERFLSCPPFFYSPPGFTFLVLFFPWSGLKSQSQSWLLDRGEKRASVVSELTQSDVPFLWHRGVPHGPLQNVFPTYSPPTPPHQLFLLCPRGVDHIDLWAFSPVDPCVSTHPVMSLICPPVHFLDGMQAFRLQRGTPANLSPHTMAPEGLTEAQRNQCCESIRRPSPPNCIRLGAEFHSDVA